MVAYARKKGIFVAANYIIGFPTETWEEIRETIKFSEEINADYSKIFIAIPLRNTEMFDLAQKTKSQWLNEKNFHESMWEKTCEVIDKIIVLYGCLFPMDQLVNQEQD